MQAYKQIQEVEKSYATKKDNYFYLDYKDAYKEFYTIEDRQKLAF